MVHQYWRHLRYECRQTLPQVSARLSLYLLSGSLACRCLFNRLLQTVAYSFLGQIWYSLDILAVLERIRQAHALWLLPIGFWNGSSEREDVEVRIGEDDVSALYQRLGKVAYGCFQEGAYREEFQEESVRPFTEDELQDTVCTDLSHTGQASRLQVLPELCDEPRRSSSGCPAELGQVCTEASVDHQLLLDIRFGELEEEDL